MTLLCLLIGISWASAQTKVTGVVTSADDGQPVIGASVVVKGTTHGTITDVNGKFTVTLPENAKTLVFSYVGMVTQERAAEPTMRVVMKSTAQQMNEVVVTALGISKSERSLGYAATTISNNDLTKSRSGDVISALSGKIPGVQVSSTSSDPGASNSIIIRGVSSLSGSNQPLFIVDGVPIINNSASSSDPLNGGFDFGNGANMINPDDVESETVLKGAAATALYGSRAAAGVVIITTKRGSGKLNVEVNSGIQFSNILRLPQFQNEFGQGWSGMKTLIENGSWGPRFDGKDRIWGTIYDNSQQIKPYVALPNNLKDFFETGTLWQNDISMSGSSDRTTYYMSASNLSNNGMLPGNSDLFKKSTLSFNGSYDYKWLKVSSVMNWANQANKFATTGQGLTMINDLYQTPRDISLVDLKNLNNPFNTPDYYYTPYGVTNPYYSLQNGMNDFSQTKTYGKVQVDIKPFRFLTFTARYGFDKTFNETRIGTPKISPDPGTPNFGQLNQQGSVSNDKSSQYETNIDLLATFTDSFGKLDITATGGTNINERGYSDVSAAVTGLDIPTFYNLSNSASTPTVSEYTSKRRLIGLLGDFQLGWDKYLYLDISARNDWSSTLPINNNSFFYPGITGSFIFSHFLPSWNKVLDFGKVRLAYGKTGNDAGVYETNPYFVKGYVYNEFGNINFPLGGQNAYRMGATLGSPSLSPEITSEFEFGMDLKLFDGRISFDGDYYQRESDKQIFALNVDPGSGYGSQYANLGRVSNKGVELLLSLIPIKTRDFSWNLSVNFSKNVSKVVSLPSQLGGEIMLYGFGTTSSTTDMMATVGKPVGEFKVTVPLRDPQGHVVVDPTTGEPIANPNLQYVGDVNNKYAMGITNTFTYKSISLSFLLDIRQGGLMYSNTKSLNYFVGNAIQTVYNGRNPFVVPNSVNAIKDNNGKITSYVENSTPITPNNMWEYFQNGCDQLNQEFLIDRSYVKLRSLSLSYDLPNLWMTALHLQGIRVSFVGNNLLLWTPKDNTFIDPDMSSFGNDLLGKFGEYSANPSARTYGFNIKVKF